MIDINWTGKNEIRNLLRSFESKKLHFVDSNKKIKLIHGDNLESLFGLQSHYTGKVKSIIIDPPYNTGYGSDMQYSDDVNDVVNRDVLFQKMFETVKLMNSNERWLSLMYSRLLASKPLLSDDGIVFVIISTSEEGRLRMLMDEVFGAENFINTIIWQKRTIPRDDSKFFSESHNCILCYANDKRRAIINKIKSDVGDIRSYQNPDNDPHGEWTLYDMCTENFENASEYRYFVETPSGKVYKNPTGGSWNFTKEEFSNFKDQGKIWFGEKGDEFPLLKIYRTEYTGLTVPSTLWLGDEVGDTREGKEDLKKCFPNQQLPFFTPKPVRLIKRLIQISTESDSIILDFFAGSGTLGQAVLELNLEEKSNRTGILIEIENDVVNTIKSRIRSINNDEIEEVSSF